MDIFGQVPQICAHPPGLMFPNVILLAEGKASLFAHWSQWDAVPQGEFYQNKLRWRRHWIPHHFPCPLSSSSQSHSVSGLHFCISILLLMCLVKSFISQDSNTDGLWPSWHYSCIPRECLYVALFITSPSFHLFYNFLLGPCRVRSSLFISSGFLTLWFQRITE